ncbi:MAG TPA: glycosyltransferase [Gaiellaceae bacterium]|nr:glycosyltransferase [Gaiellaceae bacterium]
MASPRRLRVAIVGPDPSAHGGVAGFVHAVLASSLAERYDLVAVPTHRDGTRRAKLLQARYGLSLLRRLCATGEIDLVHLNSSWKGSFARKAAAAAIARRHGCPVVLQLHGSWFQQAVRGRGLRGSLARGAAGRVARAADAVVAATPAWGAEASVLLGLDAVTIVPNTALSAANGVPRAANGSDTVLFLGRLERAKGIFELLEACDVLRPGHPKLRLVLAGRGRDAEELRELAAARGLGDTVELPGWVGDEEKQRLLASAACLALPSYAEGLPLALLEAMLSGVPVVASRVGGIPEAARDGAEALLVAPGDASGLAAAIGTVLDDRRLAHRLAEAARARAFERFGIERVAADLADVYEDVLAARARAQAAIGTAGRAGSTTSSSQRSTE